MKVFLQSALLHHHVNTSDLKECMMIVQVEPLLEVLVGKCLEQGLMEVMEEEELAAMRAHQQHYEQVRCLTPLPPFHHPQPQPQPPTP